MADTCEESSSECSDGILSDNFSIYSESNTQDKDEQNKEASGSFCSLWRHKSRSKKSSSSSKQMAKIKTKTKPSAKVLNEDRMENWRWKLAMSKGNICEKCHELRRVKSGKEGERFAKHMLSEPQKLNCQLLIVGLLANAHCC